MINNVNTEYKHLKICFHDTTRIVDVVKDYKYLSVWISKNNQNSYQTKMDQNLQNGFKSSFMTQNYQKNSVK